MTPASHSTGCAGLVLAAGAGSRYGQPKALVRDAAGRSWLQRAVAALVTAGCDPVIVVLGARGTEAAVLLQGLESVLVVHATDWAKGLSASVRAGITHIEALSGISAVAVVPVDVPDLNAATITRVIGADVTDTVLRQAQFRGRPGHPVVIGRTHWPALIAGLRGDTGAGPYVRAHGVQAVECGDLATGYDVDRPPNVSKLT